MRIVRVEWLPFHIPYAGSFTTAHGSESKRQGAIIRVHSDSGAIGHGEASPLTAFGGGTLDDALAHIAQLAAALLGTTLEAGLALLDQHDDAQPGMSAALCGFDTALLDLRAQAIGQPLARLLAEHPQPSVPVNATIGARDVAAACHAAAQAKQAGYGCVKLKVGVLDTPTAELARIAAVREQLGPDVRLRIDANAAWHEAEAISILRAAEQYLIELVEQPVADLASLARMRAASRIPIAADESVSGPAAAANVINAAAADLLVVKPMMAGGLRRARAIIEQAQHAGLRTFVTSTIDAGIGVVAALHLAATLPTPLACGLATGALLTSDLLTAPLVVQRGAMPLPDQPGLGVQLDPHKLAQHAIGDWVTR